jgi:integrase
LPVSQAQDISLGLAGRIPPCVKRLSPTAASPRSSPAPPANSVPDPGQLGLYVRIQPTGAKSFVAVTPDPYGRQIWATLGTTDVLKLEDARAKARAAIGRIKEGLPPFEQPTPRAATFEDVAAQWLKRHVKAKRLRTEYGIRRLLERHVLPRWKAKAFVAIRRSDVADLLDEVEDRSGTRQADLVLSLIRSISNWYATRYDTYVPPFVKGMRRESTKERERSRILDDAELLAVWQAAEADGARFGVLVRLLLLTAQRRQKVLAMRWADVSPDGVWTIPAEPREKTNAGELQLPPAAFDIIRAQLWIGSNPFVFPGRGDGHLGGISDLKRKFEAALPAMPQWQLHDLRRTSRSLMSRAGVPREHAERVMGHVVGGVEGTYDRHAYAAEEADALARLAALIDSIVEPRANVLPLKRGSRA